MTWSELKEGVESEKGQLGSEEFAEKKRIEKNADGG
jgi:hypothetical protein